MKLYSALFEHLFIPKKPSVKQVLASIHGTQGIAQMALQTDDFVDGTFRGSNWSPTEHLVKGY